MIGDSAYPICPCLLTPYRDCGPLTVRKSNYNYRRCASRVVIENAFGVLKQRFRQLLMLEFHTVDRLTKFVMSVCVLHNMCIMKNDTEAFYDSNLNIGDDNDEP